MLHSPSVLVFSMLFGVFYTAAFVLGAPPFGYPTALFRYYPNLGQFTISANPDGGPAILWYGWMANAFICSALISLLVPRSLAARIEPGFFTSVLVLVFLAILVYERSWFF